MEIRRNLYYDKKKKEKVLSLGQFLTTYCAAGVVVSCKIPILATRVRFPGGAILFTYNLKRDEHLKLPPERIELSTPGLQDQCSATEL